MEESIFDEEAAGDRCEERFDASRILRTEDTDKSVHPRKANTDERVFVTHLKLNDPLVRLKADIDYLSRNLEHDDEHREALDRLLLRTCAGASGR